MRYLWPISLSPTHRVAALYICLYMVFKSSLLLYIKIKACQDIIFLDINVKCFLNPVNHSVSIPLRACVAHNDDTCETVIFSEVLCHENLRLL